MRYEDMPVAEVRDGDGRAMAQAIERLLSAGVDARRPPKNPHQIKVAHDLSYYPTTGKFLHDGKAAESGRGVEALVKHLGGPSISIL